MSSPSMVVWAPMPPEPASMTAKAVYMPNCDWPTQALPGQEDTPRQNARRAVSGSGDSASALAMASDMARAALLAPSMWPQDTGAGGIGWRTVPGSGRTIRTARKMPALAGQSQRLAVDVPRHRRPAAGRHAADVEDVGVGERPTDQFPGGEDRRDHGHVALVDGTGVGGVVEDEGVAVVYVAAV